METNRANTSFAFDMIYLDPMAGNMKKAAPTLEKIKDIGTNISPDRFSSIMQPAAYLEGLSISSQDSLFDQL